MYSHSREVGWIWRGAAHGKEARPGHPCPLGTLLTASLHPALLRAQLDALGLQPTHVHVHSHMRAASLLCLLCSVSSSRSLPPAEQAAEHCVLLLHPPFQLHQTKQRLSGPSQVGIHLVMSKLPLPSQLLPFSQLQL